MCTLVILRRPGHDWPVLIGANRDENGERPWQPPGRHWPDRSEVVAGRDALAGGTWLGLNDHGVVAGVLNRPDSLGPDPRLRSRGELVLEALDHADAAAAAEALSTIDDRSYRSFNLVIADNRDAYWLRGFGPDGGRGTASREIGEGLSMITAHDLNDETGSARTRLHLPRFRAAAAPDPASGEWDSWIDILASRDNSPGTGPGEAMTVVTGTPFGTLSSSLIALAAAHVDGGKALFLFASGRPREAPYRPVE